MSTDYIEPLTVRNLEPNATIFTKRINGEMVMFRLGAAGTTQDTDRVPGHLANDLDFLRSVEIGVIELVDAPESVINRLRFKNGSTSRQARAAAVEESIEATMDRSTTRDRIGTLCHGPNARGVMGECGRLILQTVEGHQKAPALCNEHKDLVSQFVRVQTKDEDSGVTHHEWKHQPVNG